MENARARRIERFFQWPLIVAALLVLPVLVVQEAEAQVSDALVSLTNVLNWRSGP